MFCLDLEAYGQRIEADLGRAPSLEALNRIVAAHIEKIPFENLDILLGRPICVGIEAVEEKLVRSRRGGYCFEQNALLLHVLSRLGYDVTPVSARVRLGRERDFVPARTHLFLRVEIEGESWLADVGVGALSPTKALRLQLDCEQHTPHETRRIVAQGAWNGFAERGPHAVLYHQAKLDERWVDVCEFTLEPMPEIDREVANWYTSAHPGSHFRNRLVVARAVGEGRLSLLNRELKSRGADGVSTTMVLGSPGELLEVLRERFGLEFEAGTLFSCADLLWE